MKLRMSLLRYLTLLSLSSLGACNLAPVYHRPAQSVPNAYPRNENRSVAATELSAESLGWKQFFRDPRLQELIHIALHFNRDLRAQVAAIMEAEATFEVQRASLFPMISFSGGQANYTPSTNGGFSFAPGEGRSSSSIRYYNGGIGFSSYEVDLFGRIRNLSKERAEEALAARDTAQSVRITLISEVANDYLKLLADEKLLHVAEETLISQNATLKLTRYSYQHDETDALTLRQVEMQVEQAAADAAQYRRQVALDEHALQLLIGEPLPNNLPPAESFGSQTILADLPAGLPSDLLERRPDIRAAEHKLIAANADIGAARAAFFPKVALTAQEGISSLKFRTLFTPGSQTWSAAPSISLPIFTWGQNRGNLRLTKAEKLQQLATYEKTVQTAFREVSDALIARETYLNQDAHLKQLVSSSEDAYHLAKLRYDTGIDSYLTTLVQQRTLYQSQVSEITVALARYQNLVTLYRALGGGWFAENHAASTSSHRKS